MAGRCRLPATAAPRAELGALTRSAGRGAADRARAILWALDGESGAAIGARLGVRADRGRKWRQAFARGGVAAPRTPHRPARGARRAGAGGGHRPARRARTRGGGLDRPRSARAAGRAPEGARISAGHLGWLLRRRGASAGVGRATR
jgi:Homeodomain-like domain-containing protein